MRLITQNLITFVDSKEYTDRAFEAEVGWSNGFYGKVKAGKIAFSIEKLRSIVDQFPELNIHWLCTGKGEMLIPYISSDNQDLFIPNDLLNAIQKELNLLGFKEKEDAYRLLESTLALLKRLNNLKK